MASEQRYKVTWEDFERATRRFSTPEIRMEASWTVFQPTGVEGRPDKERAYDLFGEGEGRYVRAVAPYSEAERDNGVRSLEDIDEDMRHVVDRLWDECEDDLIDLYADELEAEPKLKKLREQFNEVGDQKAKELKKDRKRVFPFTPLDRPGLILDFASELSSSGAIEESIVLEWVQDPQPIEESILEWVQEYGVLGLSEIPRPGETVDPYPGRCPWRGGPADTILEYRQEAWTANILLRTYDALNAPGGPDEEALRELWDNPCDPFPLVRLTAEKAMEEQVQGRIERHCYPKLYRTNGGHFLGFGFHNLLGAMYLQFAWLLEERRTLPRRCEGPWCNMLHNNPRFCGAKCRNDYVYVYKTKPKRRGEDPLP